MTIQPYRMVGLNWFLQRITAIFLAIGFLIHFLVLHYAIEKPLTFGKVHARLSSPCWIIFDVFLLICCLYHALNGTYGIIVDYNPSPVVRKSILWLCWFVGLLAFVFGLVILVPFTK